MTTTTEDPKKTTTKKTPTKEPIPPILTVPVRDNQIAVAFEVHELDPEQEADCELIRKAGAAFAQLIRNRVPRNGEDTKAAIRKVREATWTACNAIASRGRSA